MHTYIFPIFYGESFILQKLNPIRIPIFFLNSYRGPLDNELSSIYYVRRCADAVPLQHGPGVVPLQHRYCSNEDPVW